MKISQEYAEKIRQQLKSKMKDYAGMKKGRLTFIFATSEKSKHGPYFWVAKCDCGNLSLNIPSKRSGLSCGCLSIEKSVEAAAKKKRLLSDSEVRAIKSKLMSGVSCAAVFGVSVSVISKIRTGKCYSHVQ